MKTCAICKLLKEDFEFSINRFKCDGLQSDCKLCRKEYNKNHYIKNKQKYIESNKKHREKYSQIIEDIIGPLKDKPCVDCGKTYIRWVMEFDHLNPDFKVDSITVMIKNERPLEVILEEISKCELVCANCHRIRTYQRFICRKSQR